ncbi:trypsin alpha-3-like [Ochlerotatus camptorhynchus]|uniref:trypsin alpha-3-like n=1 Tax=Ochlerotatus camptorhynchus TaxID=644619 RepID=UPI0031CED1EF
MNPVVVLTAIISLALAEGFKLGFNLDEDRLKIVGGHPIGIEQVPYQVSVQIKTRSSQRHICGGAIISADKVLTAAHCISDKGKYAVRAGSSNHNDGGQLVNVADYHIHPEFSNYHLTNDIGMLRLEISLYFSRTVSLISLAYSEQFYSPQYEAFISGWGSILYESSLSDRLQGVSVPLVSHELCSELYTDFNNITETMFCAGLVKKGGKDSCQGDSGGPVALNGYLIGIVSWGYGCAAPKYPGVYSNVFAFRNWIYPLL